MTLILLRACTQNGCYNQLPGYLVLIVPHQNRMEEERRGGATEKPTLNKKYYTDFVSSLPEFFTNSGGLYRL